MVVPASETPVQAEVIFVVEATAANSAYIGEIKANYIVPTLEFFHGGPLEEGGSSGSSYSVIAYKQSDCHPSLPVATYGPFNNPQDVIDTIDSIQYVGGHCESRACVTEALATALACCEELRQDLPIHVLLACCSPPYSAYAGGLVPQGSPATVEAASRMLCERGVQLSIFAARRVHAFAALYEAAGGELHAAQQRNYAKDPRHMVLLRGFSLKERPPSPAPPPVPEIQTDVYSQQGRGAQPAPRPPAPAFGRGQPARGNWLAPPPRQPLYANNSALLTQLAQPSYPPPPTQRLPSIMPNPGPGPSTSSGAVGPVGVGVGAAGMQRACIWSGVLEWMEKGKSPGDHQKTTKLLPCQVSTHSKEIEPELKVDTWPNKLLMQLMPKQLISSIGGQYLKDSKSVLFHLQPNEALDALTKVMNNGYAGCVHFSSPPQCDIKVLILLYTADKKAFLGFIPNNQGTFVDRLRKVIQQQKITQIINKQLPPGAAPAPAPAPGQMPAGGMPGAGPMPTQGMSSGGMGSSGMGSSGMGSSGMGSSGMGSSGMGSSGMGSSGMGSSGMGSSGMGSGGMGSSGMGSGGMGQVGAMPGQVNPAMQGQQHPQGMMMGGGMGGPVAKGGQLGGLEAARQQNLEKIQHLQQTLEAAHQQEAQFKSQMDIMSHLHAAQQQELTYKQMEEQQRKLQLQQQLQQQLRGGGGVGNVGPGVGSVGPGVGNLPVGGVPHGSRIMRPMMPQNPGLRHLLQQQPQYRPGAAAPRPPSQGSQFDDVTNYDFL